MPLTDDMHLVSTDDHLIEHPNVWADRLPARFLEDGPRIVEVDRGDQMAPRQVWQYEGRQYVQIGLNAVAGKDPHEWGIDPARFDEMLPGCWDPKERVADMDLDGVQAALCFPSFPRFAGSVFLDRLIPLVILPLWDTEACVAEIARTAAKGAKAIGFPENPVPLGLPSFHTEHWDGVFSAAEETGMPLCMHFGSSGQGPKTAEEAPMAVVITLFGCNSMYATADLLFSPVFHKHPKLKVALSEGGIGWVPYLLERADYTWERHRFYQNVNQDTPPSELFHRNVWACFIDDEHGVANRHEVGIDNITWECDYPHSDSNWPNSRKRAREVFADVPDDEVRRIVETNARELFNFPRT